MAGRRRVETRVGTPARTASIVVPFPRVRPARRPDIARILPSTRSLLVAVAIAAGSVGGYFVARDTSVFAVRGVEVDGASPAVARQVRKALRAELGTSLLRLDLSRVREQVAAVPTVANASFDRAFPHTLRVVVVPERAVAVVRQGGESWLVSFGGRIMASLPRGARPRLPRIWIAKGVAFSVGGMTPAALQDSLAAVSPLRAARFPARVASVRAEGDELTLLLRSGLEVRLGDASDVRLKLAVAAKVLRLVAADTRYLDVSVPERPVAGSVFHPPPAAAATTTDASASGSTYPSAFTVQSGTIPTLKSKLKVDGAGSTTP